MAQCPKERGSGDEIIGSFRPNFFGVDFSGLQDLSVSLLIVDSETLKSYKLEKFTLIINIISR